MILENLTPEELYVLLYNIRNVFASFNEDNYLVPDAALSDFLHHCANTIGEAYFRTPRNTIKAFIDLLTVLEQKPEQKWQELIKDIQLNTEVTDDLDNDLNSYNDDDDLVNFTL
jgi:hypothetical protein